MSVNFLAECGDRGVYMPVTRILGVRRVEEGHKGNLWKGVPWRPTNPVISFVSCKRPLLCAQILHNAWLKNISFVSLIWS